MKKNTLLAVCLSVVLMLSSCYSSTVCVGNMKPSTPAVKVNTVHNSHFISGLIGEGEFRGKDYVEGATDYKVKHQITFLDYLIGGVTLGIYTPSTTKFYVPLKSIKTTKKKNHTRYEDEDEEEED